ncbi:MAG: GNAT family N-acetyltransferase [Myxococcales bacterium]|jgi:GNAT superfamily N-acetyltransferase
MHTELPIDLPIGVAPWHSLLAECPEPLRTDLGLGVGAAGGARTLVAADVDSMLLNRAFDVERCDEPGVARVVAHYRRRGVPRFFAHVSEAHLTEAVSQRLSRVGLVRYHRRWIECARGPGAVAEAPCAFEITEATAEHADALGRILARGFDMPGPAAAIWAATVGRPGWHHHVATDRGRVVAAGTLYVRGDRGSLVAAATHPAHRRRGAQGALMRRRLLRAFELGCRLVVSETGEAMAGEPNSSANNMRRHGFSPMRARVNFAPQGVHW